MNAFFLCFFANMFFRFRVENVIFVLFLRSQTNVRIFLFVRLSKSWRKYSPAPLTFVTDIWSSKFIEVFSVVFVYIRRTERTNKICGIRVTVNKIVRQMGDILLIHLGKFSPVKYIVRRMRIVKFISYENIIETHLYHIIQKYFKVAVFL